MYNIYFQFLIKYIYKVKLMAPLAPMAQMPQTQHKHHKKLNLLPQQKIKSFATEIKSFATAKN